MHLSAPSDPLKCFAFRGTHRAEVLRAVDYLHETTSAIRLAATDGWPPEAVTFGRFEHGLTWCGREADVTGPYGDDRFRRITSHPAHTQNSSRHVRTYFHR